MQVEEVDFDEVMKALVKEVLEHPERYPEEAKVILTVEVWGRQGGAFEDCQRYEVVQGEVRELILEEFDEGYPYRRGSKVALIPLTIPTIIDLYSYTDTTDPPTKRRTVYVFTSEGWKSVKVY